MNDFEFKISSKKEFILRLRTSIDNEKHLFSLTQKRYSGNYDQDRFILKENKIDFWYASYFTIHGKIEDKKVSIRLEPSLDSYIMLISYTVAILFSVIFIFTISNEYTWIPILLVTMLIFSSLMTIKGFYNRKEILFNDFKLISNDIKTVQNNSEHP